MENDQTNVCEHGDHPAPAGLRFCSPACQTCDSTDHDASHSECAGLCAAPSVDEVRAVLVRLHKALGEVNRARCGAYFTSLSLAEQEYRSALTAAVEAGGRIDNRCSNAACVLWRNHRGVCLP